MQGNSKICPQCGRSFLMDDAFCDDCGCRLVVMTAPAAAVNVQSDYAERRKTPVWLIAAIIVLAVIAAAMAVILILFMFGDKDQPSSQTNAAVTITAEVTETSEAAAETTTAALQGGIAFVEEETQATEETAAETEPPTESKVKRFEVVADACTWDDARKKCEKSGGQLASITCEEDYYKILDALEGSGLKYVWLGGTVEVTETDDGNTVDVKPTWLDGSNLSYAFENDLWFDGEPSGGDYVDGEYIAEPYIMMWNIKDIWSLNDNSNLALDCYKHEHIGYVCEYYE